ncbi:DUF883 family protein [Tahibacter amnicola]|uniref:DUF883 domain-containing protein n=1 Tax=Tahibacter amnicola TaxID=2976241 RepID=A0ABY6BJG2_9GAMM|nr:hypothetical protein [Tahibacter amnicola]UXI69990.1 hypothetical protein N4264_10295 [Tahibacter amnicola]
MNPSEKSTSPANGEELPVEPVRRSQQGGDADLPGDGPDAAKAAHELKDALGRAWSEARDTVGSLRGTLGKGARNVGRDTREAATEARETLSGAASEFGQLGEEVADDALELARAVGLGVSRYVRRHPLQSIVVAAAAGALIGRLLRGRH